VQHRPFSLWEKDRMRGNALRIVHYGSTAEEASH
jgi:hypothetical protein